MMLVKNLKKKGQKLTYEVHIVFTHDVTEQINILKKIEKNPPEMLFIFTRSIIYNMIK